MRGARFLAPGAEAGLRPGIYHCVSRVVDRQFVLQKAEKEEFVRLMRLYEAFCGVRVLTYCVMSNHFHLLLEVPLRPEEGLPEREFFARVSLLYSEAHVADLRREIEARENVKDFESVAAIKERYYYRMWDLSQFMKTLKQRFTQWFNKIHGRRGTLWEDRFKSVIVEDGYAARVMAAYIDLNPVRAGMVKKPEEYRWCGYAEALAGRKPALEGLTRVMREFSDLGQSLPESPPTSTDILAEYRIILAADGEQRVRENERTGKEEVARQGLSGAEAEQMKDKGGKLSPAEMLRHRIRHFVDGTAIGSREFLDDLFQKNRDRFGPRRMSGARKIRGCSTSLCSIRDLRDGVQRGVG